MAEQLRHSVEARMLLDSEYQQVGIMHLSVGNITAYRIWPFQDLSLRSSNPNPSFMNYLH